LRGRRHTVTIHRECQAAIFDMDGVVTNTADHHAKAWKRVFDRLLASMKKKGIGFEPFDIEKDYKAHLSGRSRIEGIRAFLLSRSISLPEGNDENEFIETVLGIAKIKNKFYHEYLDMYGPRVYEDAISLIEILKSQNLKIGLATASKNASAVLDKTNLRPLFDTIADGNDMDVYGLRSKPEPDIFLYVADCLEVPFSKCAVFEDSHETLEQASRMSPLHAIGVERWHQNSGDERFGNLPVFSDLRSVTFQI
jgi:beta-phosphoglucomutase family hydrolase